MPTSLVVPFSPVPVLSPTRQPFGRPARSRVSPVLLPRSQPVSRSLDWRENVAEHQRAKVRQHRRGRCGVAWIARQGLVEIGLDPVEPRDRVAQRARIGGQARRAAEAREQQVAGGVVADDHRRLAKLFERHSGAADAILGDEGIHHHVARFEADAPVEPLLAGIDAREHGRGRQQLEGAAHREALVGAVTHRAPVSVSSTATPSRPPLSASIRERSPPAPRRAPAERAPAVLIAAPAKGGAPRVVNRRLLIISPPALLERRHGVESGRRIDKRSLLRRAMRNIWAPVPP